MSDARALWSSALLWLLLLVGGAWWLGEWLWRMHHEAAAQIEQIEPRQARLAGLALEAARLKQGTDAAQEGIERHAYPATRDASQAGNDAQQRARELFGAAGLEVASIQALPARALAGFDRVPVVLTVEGPLSALHAALAVLPSAAPTLFVEGVNVQALGGVGDKTPARVSAELRLYVLRARP